MKGKRKKRVFPSGGSLYSSSSPLGRARPRAGARRGTGNAPILAAPRIVLGAHPAYETVNLTIMPASGVERERTVNGIPNESSKKAAKGYNDRMRDSPGSGSPCEILERGGGGGGGGGWILFIRYPSTSFVFLLLPSVRSPFFPSLLALCLPFAL